MWLAAHTAYLNIFLTMTKTDKYTFIALGPFGKISNCMNNLISIYKAKLCDSITGHTQKKKPNFL